MKRFLRIGCALMGVWMGTAALGQTAPAEKPVWTEGFEKGLGGAASYPRDKEASKLEVVSGQAAAGGHFLRATLAGKGSLEGLYLPVSGVHEGMIQASAQVRGKGEVVFALLSSNGWLYSHSITLKPQWQTVTLEKTLAPQDKGLSVYFFAKPYKPQPGAVFEVDDLQIRPMPALQVYDTAVAGVRLEAEDFAAADQVETEGKGLKVLRDAARVALEGVPFPRTSRPVTIYARIQAPAKGSAMGVYGLRGPIAQPLGRIVLQGSEQWQWVHFKPLTAQETGDSIRLDLRAAKGSGKGVAVDAVVLSTQGDLKEEALDRIAPTFSAAPVAQVSKVSVPPTIDGSGEDACWKQTVAIRDFVHFGVATPASQGTTARLAYDDQNLYVLMTCQESILKTADQQSSALLARATARDGKVLNDDSCVIFLQPEGKEAVYEFTVNTLGTLMDAREQRTDLWGTRDVKWNSSAKTGVKLEDGYWTLEVAIPLKDLGVSGIKAGDQWRAGLVRLAQTRKEISAWNPTQAQGAHRPEELGILTFSASAVGVAPAGALTGLEPGRNTIDVNLSAGEGGANGVDLLSVVHSAKGASWQTNFAQASGKATHAFDVKATGAADARWGVLDAGTLRPLYLSPLVHTSVQASHVTLKLSTPGAYQVVVNDQAVAHGAEADAAEVHIPLRQGANVIAVRVDAGRAKVALQSPELERFGNVWRVNDAATPTGMEAKLDDRGWKLAKADAQGQVGSSGKGIILRRTIFLDETRVWPLPRPALYIAGNSTQHVNITAFGLPGKKLEHWTMYLAVPKGLKVMGSTGYYGKTVETQPQFNCEAAGEVSIDGQTVPLYKVTADKALVANRYVLMSYFQVMLQLADAKEAKAGTSWKVHYWSEANDGTVVEPARWFEVQALPPLAGKQPKHFIFQLWSGGIATMDNEDLRKAILATAQAAGFNNVDAGSRWVTDAAKAYGLTNQMRVNFKAYSINIAPFLEKNPDSRLIDEKGKPSQTLMCTTLLVGKDWSAAAEVLAQKVKETGAAIAIYDYEFSPLTGPHSCYCDRCLAAFRERAKLGADVKLTPQIIKDKYHAQWDDFMAWRVAQILALMKKTVHEAAPGMQFAAYSGYQSPRTITKYGVDWRYVGQLKAVDLASCGYGRSVQEIQDTIAALNGIPVIFGRLLHPYDPKSLSAGTVASKAIMLRRALDATGGVLLYDRNTMDGRSWLGTAEATRLVADHEDLFTAPHRLEAIQGQDPAKVQVLKGDSTSLVCVMNEGSKEATFDFQLPEALGGGKEYYSGASIAAGAKVHLKLASGEAAVYVLGK